MEQDEARERVYIVSYGTYITTWLILLLLLALNISVSQVLVKGITVLLNIIIASCMAFLNLVFFMNLRYEGRFLKMMVSLAILVLTLIILFTFSDVWFRAG
jgi:cytochrome c oxidase subunit IV